MLLHAMNASATYSGIRMVCIKRAINYLDYSFSCPVESKERCNYDFEFMSNLIIWVGVSIELVHDDAIKWKPFPRYWPFVRGIHRSPVNSPHKGQWHGALMFSLICTWINGWVNNREASDLRRHHAHYDVNVMFFVIWWQLTISRDAEYHGPPSRYGWAWP